MAMLLSLPIPLQDLILQYMTVRARALQALSRRAVPIFKRTYAPDFFVLLTRSMRMGGALSCGRYSGAALAEASMTSQRVCIAVDVPIDLAGEAAWPLPSRLRAALPGPRDMWAAGGIVGFGMKKARGTYTELKAALRACVADGTVRYASLTDNRLPTHLPHVLLEEGQQAMLHQPGPPSPELLAKLALFKSLPAALCFHRSCSCFTHWAARHPERAQAVKCLGDFILRPEGLRWEDRGALRPCPHVKKLGLAITTGRYSERVPAWAATTVAETLHKVFPHLTEIGVNLECSYECRADHVLQIMSLFEHFANVGVRVLSFEVFVIQLPSSARKRDERVELLSGQMRAAGVELTRAVRTRSTKEVPCDGFVLPAALWLSAPAAVCQGVSSAMWDTVW